MPMKSIVLAAAIVAASVVAADAAVSEAQFPPKTVRDLIGLCGPASNDPMLTASINYCHGYVEGAVIVEEAHEGMRRARKLFCLPDPPPSSGQELGGFITWANAQSTRLDLPAVDGLFLYLAQRFPCGRSK